MRHHSRTDCHIGMIGTVDGDDARWPAWADLLAARLLGESRGALGGLQIAHARRVAIHAAYTQDHGLIAAALLHDVLEKTRTSAEELRDVCGNGDVVDLVQALTHQPDETYETYLMRCAQNPRTLLVKRLDLLDKLVTDDVQVPADVAIRIRREAMSRLRRLNRMAAKHARPTDSASFA
jgi:(p)ppGpp synthase/HD superfamily hydrolase